MQNPDDIYPTRNPFTAFLMRVAGLLLFAVIALALFAGWHTFLDAAPLIIQVLVVLLLLLTVGALDSLAIDKYWISGTSTGASCANNNVMKCSCT